MEGAIRRPDVPSHFMVLKPVQKRIVVRLPDGTVLAESSNAIRLMEAGKTLYDPVIYMPKDDVSVPLTRQDKSTHCPLKGDASYFTAEPGGQTLPDIAWSYDEPLDFSQDIEGLIAFYPDKVVIEEHPDLKAG